MRAWLVTAIHSLLLAACCLLRAALLLLLLLLLLPLLLLLHLHWLCVPLMMIVVAAADIILVSVGVAVMQQAGGGREISRDCQGDRLEPGPQIVLQSADGLELAPRGGPLGKAEPCGQNGSGRPAGNAGAEQGVEEARGARGAYRWCGGRRRYGATARDVQHAPELRRSWRCGRRRRQRWRRQRLPGWRGGAGCGFHAPNQLGVEGHGGAAL